MSGPEQGRGPENGGAEQGRGPEQDRGPEYGPGPGRGGPGSWGPGPWGGPGPWSGPGPWGGPRRGDREAWRESRRQARNAARNDARSDARRADRYHNYWHQGPPGPWNNYPPRPRPGWWPENEPWPPVGEFPWRKVRRRFFARFAVAVTLVAILLIGIPTVAVGQILGATGLSGTAQPIAAFIVLLVVVLAISGTARSARRIAVPFGDMIEAVGKVEAGDYTARVAMPRHGVREMRWLADAFNSMASRLQTDEEQRRTLLADVSHELRTPLAVLRGELEAMIDGVHPIDEAHLAAAVDQISMLTKLVEDLRTHALAEGGTLPLHKESTDLAILAAEAAASFDGLAAAGDVRLEVTMPPDLPLLDIDPLRIQQVIGNLIANALRYAPRGSAISIAGLAAASTVTVSVTDAGPGIDPELLPHIFERFAKGDESRGSGLGLAIARQLVQAHGGSIKAECPAGGGTVISFELPLEPEK
jgi:two-component system sensor histidine kinase BaeS